MSGRDHWRAFCVTALRRLDRAGDPAWPLLVLGACILGLARWHPLLAAAWLGLALTALAATAPRLARKMRAPTGNDRIINAEYRGRRRMLGCALAACALAPWFVVAKMALQAGARGAPGHGGMLP